MHVGLKEDQSRRHGDSVRTVEPLMTSHGAAFHRPRPDGSAAGRSLASASR